MSRRQSTFLVVGCFTSFRGQPLISGSRSDIHATVHKLAAERGGRIVETTSRDLVAAFSHPAAALECALTLHRQGDSCEPPAGLGGWDRRIGIEAATNETEAAYDEAIDEARRLRETAEPGGVRISPKVYDAARARMGLEWVNVADPDGLWRDTANGCSVAYTTTDTSKLRTRPGGTWRRIHPVAAGVVLILGGVAVAGMVTRDARRSDDSLNASGASRQPLFIGVSEARIGRSFVMRPSAQREYTRILLTLGVTNRTPREIQVSRQDFRLDIRGHEARPLPPLGWNTRFDDSLTHLAFLPHSSQEAFRFDRQILSAGGSAIIGLQFDYPLEASDPYEFNQRRRRIVNPFSLWTTGRVVEEIGASEARLKYRSYTTRLNVDLSTDPFGGFRIAGQPSRLGPKVAVIQTVAPVHLFNAHRLWNVVEEQLTTDPRPIVVNLRRWPSPEPAVRAFLQSRADRGGSNRIAFVADGVTTSNAGFAFAPANSPLTRVWFGRETDAAAELYGRLPDGETALRAHVNSPESDIREAAIRALGAQGRESATRLLIEHLLHDPSPPVRAAAADSLGQLARRDESEVRALARAADDDAQIVRVAAFAALVKQEAWEAGRKPALRELNRRHPSQHALRIVENSGERAALPRILALLAEPGLTHEAAKTIARLGDSTAVPELLAALTTAQIGKEDILRALGRLADGSQRETVATVLRSAYEENRAFPVRQAVMDAAANLGGPEAQQLCLVGLDSAEFPVRQAAARALGKLRTPSAVPALERALLDPIIARDAAQALGEIHTPSARDALSRGLQSGSVHAQSAVRPVLAAWE